FNRRHLIEAPRGMLGKAGERRGRSGAKSGPGKWGVGPGPPPERPHTGRRLKHLDASKNLPESAAI
ncbi:MAG TPA: hypothetical protein VEZ24_09665, partial [Microvirga sp.]|nr:hypothetical protein [Microvirga sp.]